MKIDDDPLAPGALDDKQDQADIKDQVILTVARSEQIARYFANDLEELVDLTRIDLADELQIPLEYYQKPEDIIPLLFDDLERMLRYGLITGIHLILRDRNLDLNTGAYPVRYHVHYIIGLQGQEKDGGGLISFPREALLNARFVLLVDRKNENNGGSKISRLSRPDYNFDWVPQPARFDTRTIQHYREGNLTVDGRWVRRVEKR